MIPIGGNNNFTINSTPKQQQQQQLHLQLQQKQQQQQLHLTNRMLTETGPSQAGNMFKSSGAMTDRSERTATSFKEKFQALTLTHQQQHQLLQQQQQQPQLLTTSTPKRNYDQQGSQTSRSSKYPTTQQIPQQLLLGEGNFAAGTAYIPNGSYDAGINFNNDLNYPIQSQQHAVLGYLNEGVAPSINPNLQAYYNHQPISHQNMQQPHYPRSSNNLHSTHNKNDILLDRSVETSLERTRMLKNSTEHIDQFKPNQIAKKKNTAKDAIAVGSQQPFLGQVQQQQQTKPSSVNQEILNKLKQISSNNNNGNMNVNRQQVGIPGVLPGMISTSSSSSSQSHSKLSALKPSTEHVNSASLLSPAKPTSSSNSTSSKPTKSTKKLPLNSLLPPRSLTPNDSNPNETASPDRIYNNNHQIFPQHSQQLQQQFQFAQSSQQHIPKALQPTQKLNAYLNDVNLNRRMTNTNSNTPPPSSCSKNHHDEIYNNLSSNITNPNSSNSLAGNNINRSYNSTTQKRIGSVHSTGTTRKQQQPQLQQQQQQLINMKQNNTPLNSQRGSTPNVHYQMYEALPQYALQQQQQQQQQQFFQQQQLQTNNGGNNLKYQNNYNFHPQQQQQQQQQQLLHLQKQQHHQHHHRYSDDVQNQYETLEEHVHQQQQFGNNNNNLIQYGIPTQQQTTSSNNSSSNCSYQGNSNPDSQQDLPDEDLQQQQLQQHLSHSAVMMSYQNLQQQQQQFNLHHQQQQSLQNPPRIVQQLDSEKEALLQQLLQEKFGDSISNKSYSKRSHPASTNLTGGAVASHGQHLKIADIMKGQHSNNNNPHHNHKHKQQHNHNHQNHNMQLQQQQQQLETEAMMRQTYQTEMINDFEDEFENEYEQERNLGIVDAAATAAASAEEVGTVEYDNFLENSTPLDLNQRQAIQDQQILASMLNRININARASSNQLEQQHQNQQLIYLQQQQLLQAELANELNNQARIAQKKTHSNLSTGSMKAQQDIRALTPKVTPPASSIFGASQQLPAHLNNTNTTAVNDNNSSSNRYYSDDTTNFINAVGVGSDENNSSTGLNYRNCSGNNDDSNTSMSSVNSANNINNNQSNSKFTKSTKSTSNTPTATTAAKKQKPESATSIPPLPRTPPKEQDNIIKLDVQTAEEIQSLGLITEECLFQLLQSRDFEHQSKFLLKYQSLIPKFNVLQRFPGTKQLTKEIQRAINMQIVLIQVIIYEHIVVLKQLRESVHGAVAQNENLQSILNSFQYVHSSFILILIMFLEACVQSSVTLNDEKQLPISSTSSATSSSNSLTEQKSNIHSLIDTTKLQNLVNERTKKRKMGFLSKSNEKITVLKKYNDILQPLIQIVIEGQVDPHDQSPSNKQIQTKSHNLYEDLFQIQENIPNLSIQSIAEFSLKLSNEHTQFIEDELRRIKIAEERKASSKSADGELVLMDEPDSPTESPLKPQQQSSSSASSSTAKQQQQQQLSSKDSQPESAANSKTNTSQTQSSASSQDKSEPASSSQSSTTAAADEKDSDYAMIGTVPSPYLKTPSAKKYTLVLDLDETLVHYQDLEDGGQFLVRPYAETFLEEMAEYYEIIIFTAALQDYADFILDIIDAKKSISHKFYRQHTVNFSNSYIKDLSRIGRDVNKTIIIDNLPENFKLQPDNGIQIQSWYGEPEDRALYELTPLLKQIVKKRFRKVQTAFTQFRTKTMENLQKGMNSPHLNLSLEILPGDADD